MTASSRAHGSRASQSSERARLRRGRGIAALAAAVLAALTATAEDAGAQSADAVDSAAFDRAARALLRRLTGDWTLEWRGQDGRVGFTGTRTYRSLPDSLRLVWDERFDRSPHTAHGVLWYHPRARRLFYMGVHAPGWDGVLLSGRLVPGDSAVSFDLVPVAGDSVPINAGLVRSRLVVPPTGPHTWSRWDRAWVVAFRRR